MLKDLKNSLSTIKLKCHVILSFISFSNCFEYLHLNLPSLPLIGFDKNSFIFKNTEVPNAYDLLGDKYGWFSKWLVPEPGIVFGIFYYKVISVVEFVPSKGNIFSPPLIRNFSETGILGFIFGSRENDR